VERNEGTMEVGPSETGGTRVLLAFPREAVGSAREAP